MNLYVDDDGYVCFMDGEVFWTLHHDGWEAFLPSKDLPCYYSWKITFPTDDELAEVQEIYEITIKEKKVCNHIELEDEITLRVWYEEFCRPKNVELLWLPDCIYSFPEIQRELTRREQLKEK